MLFYCIGTWNISAPWVALLIFVCLNMCLAEGKGCPIYLNKQKNFDYYFNLNHLEIFLVVRKQSSSVSGDDV